MENFTIVIYGRTMAGKSTLMEILTHGDGRSIGQGNRRTTRDIRAYEWNGLKILDTPGTCSFFGVEEDEKTAFEAAKTGDLVLFLLTSDAPQPHEAEHLAELKKLGKPVLGIINVKSSIDSEPGTAKRKIDLKKIEKCINDLTTLENIASQIKTLAKRYGDDPLKNMLFVPVHLKAAFLAQQENNEELYKISNFLVVEHFINSYQSKKGDSMGNLQSKLAEFRESAQQGYDIAMNSYNDMKSSLVEEKEKLLEAERQQSNIKRLENDSRFRDQLNEMERLERETINEVGGNLDKLNKQMSNFTVVVYGRTMAGKSTLMEILTHGNGSSIGKGAQRTTQDVRSYVWNGLKILDTPGTCSFDGKVDDKTAFEAAKTGDLVLFLLTSDAPQPHEAERLAELKKLGKPVLGVVNVKSPINSERGTAKRKIDLKKIEKGINDTTSLGELVRQFKDFAPRYGVDFDDIKFVNTHLQAEYFYQREGDSELHQLSNFSAVEDFIQDKINQDGQFIRFKTFVDNVAKPMQDAIATLYSHSAGTVNGWDTYNDKINQLDDWYGDKDRGFCKSLQNRYDEFYKKIVNQFASKINYVVNNYYDSQYAGDRWKDAIDELNLSQQCQDFIRKIGNEVTQKLRRLSDELNQEARYSNASFSIPKIAMDDITDFQGGLMAAAPLLMLTPVGWAGAAIVGIGAWLFGDSKEEKINKAKRELREKLEESRDDIISKINNSVLNTLNNDIHKKQIWGFRNTLFEMRDMMTKLAYAQNRIADTINDQYGSLNFNLMVEARKYTHDNVYLDRVIVSRIVGSEFVIFSTAEMSSSERREMSNLLGGEKIVSFKVSDENYWDDVNGIVERNILNDEFSWATFYKGSQGNMHLICIPKRANISNDKIQLVQQLYSDPVIRE